MTSSPRVTRSAAVVLLLATLLVAHVFSPAVRAQALAPDASTLWLARFDGTPDDARPDTVIASSSLAWTTGRIGQGLQFASPAQLSYARDGNIDGTAGTIEFWVRPNWNGNDGQSHTVLECGGVGGILVVKDGANNLRIIVNRYGANGYSEMGAAYGIGSWTAGTWHYCTFTWSNTSIRVYTDGTLRASQVPVHAPPALTQGDLYVGSQGGADFLNGTLDELRISSVVRASYEITAAAGGATLAHDGSTLFLAHYEGDATGTADAPDVATAITYDAGVMASAANLGTSTDLRIGAARHIGAAQGTIEFWLRPEWNGNDGAGHAVLEYGVSGGLLVMKDGGNYWRLIVNRWGPGGAPEMGVGVYIGNTWTAGAWRHCAFTWAPDSLHEYIDGEPVAAVACAVAPPAIAASQFRLGRESYGSPLNARVDELRISSVVRTLAEIRAARLATMPLDALVASPDTAWLAPGAHVVPTLRAVSGPDSIALPAGLASWSTSEPNIVAPGANDTLWAFEGGTAQLTASWRGHAASLVAIVQAPTLLVAPEVVHAWASWPIVPVVRAVVGSDTTVVPPGTVVWASSDPAIVEPGDLDTLWTRGGGDATLTASWLGASASLTVSVRAPVREPEHEALPEDLTTPAANAVWPVPVLIIRYLPTADGENLDTSISPDFWEIGDISLADLDANILAMNRRVKFALEQGSRFRGYANPGARPSLGYRVVDQITLFEQTPPGKVIGYDSGDPVYEPDWFAIFDRLDVRHYVEDLGVKEVWVWGPSLGHWPSFDPEVHHAWDIRGGWESNMSSPVTGDISNSNRDATDLPVYANTYVVYGYNYRRSQAEAVHDHGHQIESQFGHVDGVDNGIADLFWDKFRGRDGEGNRILGRCGDTHSPPNTLAEYDYENPNQEWSDIADWTPYGTGTQEWINADTWGTIEYPWPDGIGDFSQRVETQWYMYWMQSMPGWANTITYDADWLTNWWEFIGDWDGAMTAHHGLQSSSPTAGVAPSSTRSPSLAFAAPTPNPMRGAATFTLVLGTRGPLRVGLYDVQGRLVRTLRDGESPAGEQRITWDGRDEHGARVAPGLYLARAEGNGRALVRRVCLLR